MRQHASAIAMVAPAAILPTMAQSASRLTIPPMLLARADEVIE
jgi:hypothetical protein